MLKMNLQFFSHHKGGSSLRQATSCIASAVPRSILVKTLAAAATIPCLRLLTALSSLNASAVTRRRFQFIRQQLLNKY